MSKIKKISCVIDRLEETKAVLKFDDGQTLIVDIDFLPEGVGEGKVLDFDLVGQNNRAEEDRSKQAKALLNEILKK